MTDYLPELTRYCLDCHERHVDGVCRAPLPVICPPRSKWAPLLEVFGFFGYSVYVLIKWAVALGVLAAVVWFVHLCWRLT